MNTVRLIRFAIVISIIGGLCVGAEAGPLPVEPTGPCPEDINCSGQIDVSDLLAVLGDWGMAGSDADVDGSGVVDVGDLLKVLGVWGPCIFDFGPTFANAEAEQIGLELLGVNGPLLLDQVTFDRIDRDLGLMRTAFPALVTQTHSMAWLPNHLIVSLKQNVSRTNYDCLNTFYQMINEQHLFTSQGLDWKVLTFADGLNVVRLATIYTQLPEVDSTSPDSLIGGANFWTPTPMLGGTWRWNIDDGFLDCFDGCDCHNLYVIDIDAAGNVTLISFLQSGFPWCDFGTSR